jgi:3-phosphoshikimate 1-carboxyvinyltransferase
MPLPDLIEIVPLDKPLHAEITVPGSKSITNRALILAALADGETKLQGALWSEDTQVMVEALRKLGFEVKVEPDQEEFCNRLITVKGLAGKIPNTGTKAQPLELFVGNAGTAARFLAALVCLGKGAYRLHGVPRMHERPQEALFRALRELGYEIEAENRNERLPTKIFTDGPAAGFQPRFNPITKRHEGVPSRSCSVSIEQSSQFASALLLCANVGGWNVEVFGENAEESPYVTMTSELIKVFPKKGGTFQIEPDASSGAYFEAAERLAPWDERLEYSAQFGVEVSTTYLARVTIANSPRSGWQIDQHFAGLLPECFALSWGAVLGGPGQIPKDVEVVLAQLDCKSEISRSRDLGDSIMMAIVLGPFSVRPLRFTDLGRLRVQETERVVALRTELTKCSAKVVETGDTLEVFPSKLHGAEIETYDDHRMAMCFAILGLKVPGIKIKNPSCVKKTFPNFFQKLAAAPPHGLGAEIRDAKTGRRLPVEELFAD